MAAEFVKSCTHNFLILYHLRLAAVVGSYTSPLLASQYSLVFLISTKSPTTFARTDFNWRLSHESFMLPNVSTSHFVKFAMQPNVCKCNFINSAKFMKIK